MADYNSTNTWSDGQALTAPALNQNFDDTEDVFNGDRNSYSQVPSLVPIGAIVAWLKTFAAADSGNTDGIGLDTNVLRDTGQNFLTTVSVGMIVHNTTDNTFANVVSVDSDTQLTLDADIMDDGENYTIYKTPQLPDGWVECDNSIINDADSPYNGVNAPDLNSASNRFLRGNISSGATGGNLTHNHGGVTGAPSATVIRANLEDTAASPTHTHTISSDNHEPPYYDVVWIMRIK
jgi:hypothetical protein